jgi:hypothetical protein
MRLAKFRIFSVALIACALTSTSAQAVVVWDESTNGDLSGNRFAPTNLPLSVGTSSIAGSMSFSDKEYFTVVIPANDQLSSINLTGWEGDDFLGFIAVQAGNQMTVPPETGDATGLLGWFHVGDFAIGNDILPFIGQGSFGATGFTPPLTSGAYTFWLQQIDGLLVTYSFDFNVTGAAVSVPGDYNQNGTVDAGDYNIWRKQNGQTVPTGTGADGSGASGVPDGVVNSFDYTYWRSRFGNPSGAGSITESTIPEPPATWLTTAATITIAFCRFNFPRSGSKRATI